MTYISGQRIRLKAQPEKCGRVEYHNGWSGWTRVKWDANRRPCEILAAKIELDPDHEAHNAKLGGQQA